MSCVILARVILVVGSHPSRISRKSCAIAWLLALAMPFQALTAVYLDVRGPAHFHVEHDDDHDHHHAHGVEHHHHHHDDRSVVAVHDHDLPLQEEAASGWSGTMLVALPAGAARLQLLETSSGLTPAQAPLLQTRFPGRLERPPRINPA